MNNAPATVSAGHETGKEDRVSGTRGVPFLIAAALLPIYLTFSLLRHNRMETAGYDLGIFDQAVREYSRFHAPIVPLKGPDANLLGDHFHPLLALLAPLYWVWSDPRTLLIAQAALIAVSAVPVARLAIMRLGRGVGIAISGAYGLSWGIQGAVAFDFHEVAFAVPLMAFALAGLAEGRWRAAVAWTLPLLLVKEDLGLVVTAVGCYLLLKKRYRLGAFTLCTGAIGLILTITVIIPYFNWAGRYRYWSQMNEGGQKSTYETLLDVPAGLVAHPEKALLLLLLLAVSAFAAVRSPLVIVGLPVALYRIVSTQPLQWSIGEVHYNTILMPVAFVALLDSVRMMTGSRRSWVRRYARRAPVAAVVVGVMLLPYFSFWRFTDPGFYGRPAHAEAARRLLSEIPDGASVAAGNYLAPQLTDRCTVTLFADVHRRPVDWVVVDSKRLGGVPAPAAVQLARLRSLPSEGFRLVRQEDGVLLFRRG